MTPAIRRSAAGFSLIELLVVLSIIAVLAGLLLPAVRLVRQEARNLQCHASLRQLCIAHLCYAEDWSGLLVRVKECGAWPNNTVWDARIVPYLEVNRARVYCPNRPLGQTWQMSYGMHANIGGKQMPCSHPWGIPPSYCFGGNRPLASISRAADEVLMADSDTIHVGNFSWGGTAVVVPWGRHGGRNAVAGFVDGHTAIISPGNP